MPNGFDELFGALRSYGDAVGDGRDWLLATPEEIRELGPGHPSLRDAGGIGSGVWIIHRIARERMQERERQRLMQNAQPAFDPAMLRNAWPAHLARIENIAPLEGGPEVTGARLAVLEAKRRARGDWLFWAFLAVEAGFILGRVTWPFMTSR